MLTKNSILTQLAEARQRMRSLVSAIDAGKIVYPEWTIKEVLAHIAGWDELAIKMLKAGSQDPMPPELALRSLKRYNAQSVAQRKQLDLQQTIADWEQVRQQLATLVADMQDDFLVKPIKYPWGGSGNMLKVLKILADHELEHAEEIEIIVNFNPTLRTMHR